MGFTIAAETGEAPKKGGFTIAPLESAVASPSSNTAVAVNAAYKGAAGLPDMILNAPNNVLNLGKAAFGTAATAMGRSDLAPDLTPNPDLARRGAEAIGLIDPKVIPQGGFQKGVDLLTQGAVGGALTGGAGVAKAAVGAGMGALSAGSAGATEALGGSPALVASAGLAAPAAAGRIMSSAATMRPDARTLNDQGVSMTPGQIKGGVVQRLEDAATSVFGLGDMVKGAHRRSLESFGTVAMNRALSPIGETVPKGLAGNAAVGHIQDTLGAKYDSLYGKMSGSLDGPQTATAPGTAVAIPGSNNPAAVGAAGPAGKPTLRDELTGIQSMGASLPPQQRAQLDSIIKQEIMDRFTSSGNASGETVQNIKSKLGQLASDLSRSKNYDERTLGGAVKEMQSAVRRMVDDVNPQYAGEQLALDRAYANFKIIQKAASSVAAKDGVFTPAMLHAAVKSQDRSMDKGKFARGDAMMQDLSQPGKNVLSQTVPDSGTASRALLGSTMLGGGGYIANHPIAAGVAAGGSLAAMLPYTKLGGRAFQALLTRGGNPEYNDISGRVAPIVTSETLYALMRQNQ